MVVLMLSQALAKAPDPNDPGDTISKANKEVEEFLNRKRDSNVTDGTLIFNPVITIMSSLKVKIKCMRHHYYYNDYYDGFCLLMMCWRRSLSVKHFTLMMRDPILEVKY